HPRAGQRRVTRAERPGVPGCAGHQRGARPAGRCLVRLDRSRSLRRPPASERRWWGDLDRDRRPEYPPKPEGVAEINPMSQREVAWATQLGWVIEPGHTDEPGVLWCGTIPGGLFRSDD